uniref:Uncharacterized protein n=1 Tax=viral metagenome TaxID=1070528 RepID=A0A6M3JUH5_9ZZZZ
MKPGRKKGQTAANAPALTSFTLKDMERDFWRRVKILALNRGVKIGDLIVSVMESEIKNAKIV